MLNEWFPNVKWDSMWEATMETLYMTAISVLATFILGAILGLLLFLTSKGNIWKTQQLIKSFQLSSIYSAQFHLLF